MHMYNTVQYSEFYALYGVCSICYAMYIVRYLYLSIYIVSRGAPNPNLPALEFFLFFVSACM